MGYLLDLVLKGNYSTKRLRTGQVYSKDHEKYVGSVMELLRPVELPSLAQR